jgi:hypothetical protein
MLVLPPSLAVKTDILEAISTLSVYRLVDDFGPLLKSESRHLLSYLPLINKLLKQF